MGRLGDHESRRRLISADPSDHCLICGKPLNHNQERFCSSAHKDKWHSMARDIGEFVMEMMREVYKR